MLCCCPQGTGVVHEVAVGLEVQHELVSAAVGEANTEGHPDLCRGTQRTAGMSVWFVEVPELPDPLAGGTRGQDPVLIFNYIPRDHG